MALPQHKTPSGVAELILGSLAVGVFTVDPHKRITFLNQAAEKAMGLRHGEALGKNCDEVFQCSLCGGDCPLVRAMTQGRGQTNLDAVFNRGEKRPVLPVKLSASPLYDRGGKLIGGVETFHSLLFNRCHDNKADQELTWEDFLGNSPDIESVFATLKAVAPRAVTVLIEGPTGSGKDLLARIIHNSSPRSTRPFIKLGCDALPEHILEAELFGFVAGAFHGAERDSQGLLHRANGGTLFLDQITALPPGLQAKLLKLIEEGEYYPLGSRRAAKADVRLLAACNTSLENKVRAREFREDLLYRLNQIQVIIPPLAQRPEDIPLLIQRFIQRKNVVNGTYICRLTPKTLDCLLNYSYPGNVRELENILEHACLLCRGEIIRTRHLPQRMREAMPVPSKPSPPEARNGRQELIKALEENSWHRGETARALNINRSTLWRRMKRYGIDRPQI